MDSDSFYLYCSMNNHRMIVEYELTKDVCNLFWRLLKYFFPGSKLSAISVSDTCFCLLELTVCIDLLFIKTFLSVFIANLHEF